MSTSIIALNFTNHEELQRFSKYDYQSNAVMHSHITGKGDFDMTQGKHLSIWRSLQSLIPSSVRYVRNEIRLLNENFIKDFFGAGVYCYPFIGLYHFLTSAKYWKFLVPLLYPYVMLTIGVAIAYYFLVFPILLGNLTLTLGVIGFALAHIQFVFEVNAISLTIARILLFPSNREMYFDFVLRNQNQEDFLTRAKLQSITKMKKTSSENNFKKTKKCLRFFFGSDKMILFWKNRNNAGFWIDDAPLIAFSMMFDWVFMLVIVFSSLIPLFGPFLVLFMSSHIRTQYFLNRFFQLKKMSNESVKKQTHKHYGQFLAFGLTSGLLESLPFLSLVFEFSNLTAGAIWASDLINQDKKKL